MNWFDIALKKDRLRTTHIDDYSISHAASMAAEDLCLISTTPHQDEPPVEEYVEALSSSQVHDILVNFRAYVLAHGEQIHRQAETLWG
jgi:hypothetical protein